MINQAIRQVEKVVGLQDGPIVSTINGKSGDVDLTYSDITGVIPSSSLPSYVDDVIEVDNYSALTNIVGETGKIYITKNDQKSYRWTGSFYLEISPSQVTSVAGKTGAVNVSLGDLSDISSLSASAYKPAVNAYSVVNGSFQDIQIGYITGRHNSLHLHFVTGMNFGVFLPGGENVLSGDLYSIKITENQNIQDWRVDFKSNGNVVYVVTKSDSDFEKSNLRFIYKSATWELDTTIYHTHDYNQLINLPPSISDGYFDRNGNAQTRPGYMGQAPYQVVLSNDTRLIDARRPNWVSPPVSPFMGELIPAENLEEFISYEIAIIGNTNWLDIGFPSFQKFCTGNSNSTILNVEWPLFGIYSGINIAGTGIQPGTKVIGFQGTENIIISNPTSQLISGELKFYNDIYVGSTFTKNSVPGTGNGFATRLIGGDPYSHPPGTMAYDGSFLYITVPMPGGQDVRWGRVAINTTW